jgi:hypothetical protein
MDIIERDEVVKTNIATPLGMIVGLIYETWKKWD